MLFGFICGLAVYWFFKNNHAAQIHQGAGNLASALTESIPPSSKLNANLQHPKAAKNVVTETSTSQTLTASEIKTIVGCFGKDSSSSLQQSLKELNSSNQMKDLLASLVEHAEIEIQGMNFHFRANALHPAWRLRLEKGEHEHEGLLAKAYVLDAEGLPMVSSMPKEWQGLAAEELSARAMASADLEYHQANYAAKGQGWQGEWEIENNFLKEIVLTAPNANLICDDADKVGIHCLCK